MREFWRRLLNLTGRDRRRDSTEAVLRELEEMVRHAKPREEFTFEYLAGRFAPIEPDSLAAALAYLVSRGTIKQIIRIESPATHGGIRDFGSFQEVPDAIYDWHADEDLDVRPEHLRVVYKPVWAQDAKTNSPSLAMR